jgi:hypothetical protein
MMSCAKCGASGVRRLHSRDFGNFRVSAAECSECKHPYRTITCLLDDELLKETLRQMHAMLAGDVHAELRLVGTPKKSNGVAEMIIPIETAVQD